ncbi:MAG: hypothetical protein ACYDHM_05780 [Acidiferrobacterales bacterium]
MRTRVIYPDQFAGGWEALEGEIITLHQEFIRREGVELPLNLPGRWGEFLRAAQGGKTIKEISALMNITAKRASQILAEMLEHPEKLAGEIEAAKTALFPFDPKTCKPPEKSRRGRKPGKKRKTVAGTQVDLFGGGA